MILLALPGVCSKASAAERGWEFEPYRIHAVLAIDVPGGLAEQLASQLPQYLPARVDAAIGPVWSFDLQLATGVLKQSVLSNLDTPAAAPPAESSFNGDKLLLVALRWTPEKMELTAREFDRFVARWGTPIRRESRQKEMLPEQLFALIWQTVAPLTQLQLDPDDDSRVVLRPRGAALMRAGSDNPWIRPGDILLPVLRRTTRSGELAENGIQVVPWTYVEAVEVENDKIIGHVHSGNRQPFGARRLGRIEQVAIALRAVPDQTQLLLHSRSNPDKPLVGYEVFSQIPGEETTTRVGASDREGRVIIPPSTSPVQMLIIKNGGHLLARLPVVPGAESEIEVPLRDDDIRLAAEARLAALREELIDVVARRNILMARARQKIEANDFDAAQQLLRSIDELPGRSQFNLALTTASRLLRSDDPQIQRRIDQLFQVTQTVLSQYLDTRPISQLHDELRDAQRKQT